MDQFLDMLGNIDETNIQNIIKYSTERKKHNTTISNINDLEKNESNYFITEIDLYGCKEADKLIDKIVECKKLASLQKINLSCSDISLDGLEKLKTLSIDNHFVRMNLDVSARFGSQVITIQVNVSNTDIAKNNRWELNNKISVPNEEYTKVMYLNNGEIDEAHLQILPNF